MRPAIALLAFTPLAFSLCPALATAQPIEVPALPTLPAPATGAAASAAAAASVTAGTPPAFGAAHRSGPAAPQAAGGLLTNSHNSPQASPQGFSQGNPPRNAQWSGLPPGAAPPGMPASGAVAGGLQPGAGDASLAGGDAPASLPPALRTLSPDKPLTHRQSLAVSQAAHWRQRAARASVDADGWVHFPFGNGEPFVVCAVLHICDIRLQPGEHVIGPPDISDPRWIVHPRYGVDGGTPVTHVIVKPSDSGLDGNIVLHTDRRTYSIGLVSREREYMPLVMFDYADDNGGEWPAVNAASTGGLSAAGPDDPCDATPIVPPSAFRITGPHRAWTPAQVWIVATPAGEKTCIEFPSDIGSAALPALVAEADDATWFSDATPLVVNFRYLRRRFEVDEAMERFALVSGVGDNQEKDEVRRRTP